MQAAHINSDASGEAVKKPHLPGMDFMMHTYEQVMSKRISIVSAVCSKACSMC